MGTIVLVEFGINEKGYMIGIIEQGYMIGCK